MSRFCSLCKNSCGAADADSAQSQVLVPLLRLQAAAQQTRVRKTAREINNAASSRNQRPGKRKSATESIRRGQTMARGPKDAAR